MTKFEDLFNELSRTNDRSIIWNNWLDYCININLMQTKSKYAPKDFYGNEETYFEMFNEWIMELHDKISSGEKNYYDMIGELYEANVQSKGKAKDFQQYFTPQTVTELMGSLVMDTWKKNSFCSDPCCGSGRFLLEMHCDSKGELFCIGQDLDETSCKMSVLNLYSHGVRGSVLHMNTLTGEFYKGWRVNRWLLHGVPVPHIEEIYSVSEAFDFLGVGNDKSKDVVDGDVQVSSGSKIATTKQSTLV